MRGWEDWGITSYILQPLWEDLDSVTKKTPNDQVAQELPLQKVGKADFAIHCVTLSRKPIFCEALSTK